MRSFVSGHVLDAVRDGAGESFRRGESRLVTVLFSHIRDFSRLCREHPPEAIFGMLEGFLAGAEHCIRDEGGEVDKFIGDAVMALFHAEDAPHHAVRAARALRAFVGEFNRARTAAGAFPVTIGIGVNTGRVILGDVGSRRRRDLTVIGDAVNLAARLEAASHHGRHTGIVLSEDTFLIVCSTVRAEEMAITSVKGKQGTIRMFELLDEAAS